MTNRQVGEAVGTTEHQVWRWRKGRVRPSDTTLAALAEVLGRDLAWFYVDHAEAA
jgi:transcriptional regulator with XRE-family HTH domain